MKCTCEAFQECRRVLNERMAAAAAEIADLRAENRRLRMTPTDFRPVGGQDGTGGPSASSPVLGPPTNQ